MYPDYHYRSAVYIFGFSKGGFAKPYHLVILNSFQNLRYLWQPLKGDPDPENSGQDDKPSFAKPPKNKLRPTTVIMDKLSTKEILQQNLSRNTPGDLDDVIILLHNVRSMHNVGAAFRSADAFGIRKILLSGYSPTPPRPEISKTAIGAEKHVDWQYLDDLQPSVESFKNEGYLLVGLEQTTESILLPDYNIAEGKKICLVFGNEVTGVDEDLLSHIDDFVEIPQYGHKHSLNVSVTVGVALYAFLEKYW